MDLEDKMIAIIVIAITILFAGGLTAVGVWAWRDASDKRDCRRAGGTVELLPSDHTEWHCVGAQPEGKP